jgi:hypothetical protein
VLTEEEKKKAEEDLRMKKKMDEQQMKMMQGMISRVTQAEVLHSCLPPLANDKLPEREDHRQLREGQEEDDDVWQPD